MALEYIASTGTPSGSFLEIDNIPNTYNSLQITGAMSNDSTTVADCYMRFNDVTTTTYNSMYGGWRDGSTSNYNMTNNEAHFGRGPDQDMNVGFVYAPVYVDIFAYRGDQPGNLGWFSIASYANGTSDGVCQFYSGWYSEDATADLTKIQFITSQGSWDADTVFHLYGRTTS
tara:strand:+ start:645 stop:1160 length:516 start_codon:yes stop_codon:yes gene_type:complete